MRPSDLPQVRTLQLFSSMSDDNFELLMQAAYLQNFPAQLELIREGDPADFLYVVIDGCVELYARSNGRETTMSMVRPVGTFILAAVLKDAVYLMSARTCDRCRLLLVPAQNIRVAFEMDEAFARSIVIDLANAYRSVIKQQKDLKLRTAVERLANRLLSYQVEQGKTGSVELPHDKRTLASLLGMMAENLSRAFNTLKPYGVEVNGSVIKLHDLNALRTLAKPTPLIDDSQT